MSAAPRIGSDPHARQLRLFTVARLYLSDRAASELSRNLAGYDDCDATVEAFDAAISHRRRWFDLTLAPMQVGPLARALVAAWGTR